MSRAAALRRGLCTARMMEEVPWKVVRACEGVCRVDVRIEGMVEDGGDGGGYGDSR